MADNKDAWPLKNAQDVAGALELAGAVRLATHGTRLFDGYIVLGCVVRGQTDHYEYVCREAMAGLTQVVLQFGLCLGNGLLTVDRVDQALVRAALDGHNKGAEAAVAALVGGTGGGDADAGPGGAAARTHLRVWAVSAAPAAEAGRSRRARPAQRPSTER